MTYCNPGRGYSGSARQSATLAHYASKTFLFELKPLLIEVVHRKTAFVSVDNSLETLLKALVVHADDRTSTGQVIVYSDGQLAGTSLIPEVSCLSRSWYLNIYPRFGTQQQ